MRKHFEQTSVTQTEDVQNIVESLIGSIPNIGLALNELRKERLEKYETAARYRRKAKIPTLYSKEVKTC